MRLPIYRKLDEPFKIMGLEPIELGVVGGVFVLSVQVFGSADFGLLLALLFSSSLFGGLLFIKKSFEPACIRKWIRFSALPDQLYRKFYFKEKNN